MVPRLFNVIFFMLICLCVAEAHAEDAAHQFDDNKKLTIFEPPLKPTNIDIGISLLQVLQIEPASVEQPKITAQFKIRLQWQDDRLATPSSNEERAYQDADATEKLSSMFDPRIAIVDGTMELDHQHLTIYPNGTVNLSKVVLVTVPANMELLLFPFDSQIFTFRFASTYWGDNEIDLVLNPLESTMMPDSAPVSWDFDYFGYHVTKTNVRAHSESFFVYNFMVHAQRDPRNFFWRLLLPLIVIVILSWNVFWMYEDSSSALANCFVFLLTVVAFHQIANEMLPLIPYFTFLDSIVFLSYGFIIIPTFQVMVTTKLEAQGRSAEAATIRQYCRWFVPLGFAVTLLITTIGYFASV